MNHNQPEEFFKRVEVSIAMEKRVPLTQAERCD
jgi:hypothetical protein